MRSVARDMWRFGYLFVDSSNPTCRRELDVNRCEVNFTIDKESSVTLFFQVSGMDKTLRKYTLFLFQEEQGENLVMYADIDYVVGFSNSIQFEFNRIGTTRINRMTEEVIHLLHPIIHGHLIEIGPPMCGDRPALVWYLGFTRRILTEVEYGSKMILRDVILELHNVMPS